MRQLTSKQKKLIEKWVSQQEVLDVVIGNLPRELYQELKAINDTEILYQNVGYYIRELRVNGKYKKELGF